MEKSEKSVDMTLSRAKSDWLRERNGNNFLNYIALFLILT